MSNVSFQPVPEGILIKNLLTGKPLGLAKQVYSEKHKCKLWIVDGQPKVGYASVEEAGQDLFKANKKMILDPDTLKELRNV